MSCRPENAAGPDAYDRYLDFVQATPHFLINPQEQLYLLQDLDLYKSMAELCENSQKPTSMRAPDLAVVQQIAGYEAPDNQAGLLAMSERIGDQYRHKNSYHYSIEALELFNYLKVPEHHELDLDYALNIIDNVSNNVKMPLLKAGLREALNDFLDNNDLRPRELGEKIAHYKEFDEKRLFPSQSNSKNRLLTTISDEILAMPDPVQRQDQIEMLLSGTRLHHPDIRDRLIDAWVATVATRHGLDDMSTDYQQGLMASIAGVVESKTLNPFDRQAMMEKLATATDSGRDLSALLCPEWSISAQEMEKTQNIGLISQGIFALLERDKENNQAVIDYLSTPKTETSIDQMEGALKKIIQGALNIGHSNGFDQTDIGTVKDYIEAVNLTRTDVEAIYDNFWNAPVEARTVCMNRLLANHSNNWKSNFDHVAEKMFAADDENAPIGKKLLAAYVESLPEYQRGLMVSAMMVAAQKNSTDQPLRVGQALGCFAENMDDPAIYKACQAIHSNPSTPQDIKQDLKQLKSNTSIPNRKELFELYDQSVPSQLQGQIKTLGRVLGAGSYYLTVEAKMQDGSRMALAMLKDHARVKAAVGFDRLMRTADILAREDNSRPIEPDIMPSDNLLSRFFRREKKPPVAKAQGLGRIIAPMRQAIQMGQKMVAVETNSDLGAQQVMLASALYDGMMIEVDQHQFEFKTANWRHHGENYKLMDMAAGEHSFNTLPEATIADKNFKKSMAKAYVTAELVNILRGGCFDHDRHGEQFRIETKGQKTILSIIDTGAMALEPPGKLEKELMGEILFEAYMAQKKGQSIGAYMAEKMENLSEKYTEIPVAVMDMQKALLALSDFHTGEDFAHPRFEAKDWKDVFDGVQKTGLIDNNIQNSFLWSAAHGTHTHFWELGDLMPRPWVSDHPVKVTIQDTRQSKPSVPIELSDADKQRLADRNPGHYVVKAKTDASAQPIIHQSDTQVHGTVEMLMVWRNREIETKPTPTLGYALSK